VAAQAVTGGIMESLQGGSFGHGFMAAGLTAAFMPHVREIGNDVARTAVGALVGGTISQATGGKFANGAVSGAIQAAMAGGAGSGKEVAGSGGAGGGGAGDPSADAFLQGESANAGQLFCTAECSATPDAAHAAAGDRYLGASLASRREAAWRVYNVGDGSFSFTYPNISGVGGTQVALPSRLSGFSFDSAGHTHWDSNWKFSPQDWRLITQGVRHGAGIKLYVATGDGRLQFSTPAKARGLGIMRGASFMPPVNNFSGQVVPGVQLRTTYP
jgi:hypothetical protein